MYKKRFKNRFNLLTPNRLKIILHCDIEGKKDFCMTTKESRKSFGELNSAIYPPANFRSVLMKYRQSVIFPFWSRRLIRRKVCHVK